MNPSRYEQAWKAGFLVLLGVLIGVAFLNAPGTDDARRWVMYVDLARKYGVFGTYPVAAIHGVGGAATDYPPLSLIILALLAGPADLFHITDFMAVKISIIVFTLACAGAMSLWRPGGRTLFGVAIFILLALDALVLAYIDVYFVVFLLLSYYCLERGWLGMGTALFVVSFLTKWQPIILAPLVILYVLPRCRKTADFVRFVPAIGLLLLAFGVYGTAMTTAFTNGVHDPAISAKALNVNWLITAFVESDWPASRVNGGLLSTLSTAQLLHHISIASIGAYWAALDISTALRYVCYLIGVLYFTFSKRTLEDLVRTSVACFFAYFIFGMAVHENHQLVPAVLALCWLALARSRWFEALALGVMFNLNLFIFYGINGDYPIFSRLVGGWDTTIFLAIANIVLFGIVWTPLAVELTGSVRKSVRPLTASLPASE